MDVSLLFDTEDYTSPPEAGLDDIPKWLAETMTDEGITGTFLMIGNKARSLRERGRNDVIRAMAAHEIGYHTNFGSEHPTLTEETAPASWDDGVRLSRRRESPGIAEVSEIFGRQVTTCSRHGGSETPQMSYVAGRDHKLPWLYGYPHIDDSGVCSFAGTLHLDPGNIEIREDSYSDNDTFQQRLDRLDRQIRAYAERGRKWIGVFCGHPLMIKAKEFNDALNFADGTSHDPQLVPRLRSEPEIDLAKMNFRRLVCFIRDHELLTNRTIGDVVHDVPPPPRIVSREDIARVAKKAVTESTWESGGGVIPFDEPFSPAEAFLCFIHALAELGTGLPDRMELPPETVLGPVKEPIRRPENPRAEVSLETVSDLAAQCCRYVADLDCLPHWMSLEGDRMGLGTLYLLFALAYLRIHRAEPAGKGHLTVPHLAPRYPECAYSIEATARRWYLDWPIHDPELPLENLSRLYRLQSWTVKQVR